MLNSNLGERKRHTETDRGIYRDLPAHHPMLNSNFGEREIDRQTDRQTLRQIEAYTETFLHTIQCSTVTLEKER